MTHPAAAHAAPADPVADPVADPPADPVADPAASPAAAAVRALAARGQTLAAVESLTGGLLAATIVEIPGVSAVFRGGLVVYATDLKARLAGVPRPLLAERGPVDPDVSLALAAGGRERLAADWALATTGVAGPDPQGGKPVGLVYVALAGPGVAQVRELRLVGDRPAIRAAAVDAALALLTSFATAYPGSASAS